MILTTVLFYGYIIIIIIIIINWHFKKRTVNEKSSHRRTWRRENLITDGTEKYSVNVWNSPVTQTNDAAQTTECYRHLVRMWRTLGGRVLLSAFWAPEAGSHQPIGAGNDRDGGSRHTESWKVHGRPALQTLVSQQAQLVCDSLWIAQPM